MKLTVTGSTVVALAVALGSAGSYAQDRRPLSPPLVISSLSSADLFQFYCAGCHGPRGKGDGPMAPSLKNLPPDLTTIAARNDGRFPSEALERYVAGDHDVPSAHGSREMPVWGPIFRSLEPHDRLTQIRIANLVAFIETLQRP